MDEWCFDQCDSKRGAFWTVKWGRTFHSSPSFFGAFLSRGDSHSRSIHLTEEIQWAADSNLHRLFPYLRTYLRRSELQDERGWNRFVNFQDTISDKQIDLICALNLRPIILQTSLGKPFSHFKFDNVLQDRSDQPIRAAYFYGAHDNFLTKTVPYSLG